MILLLLLAITVPSGDYVMQGVHKRNVKDAIILAPSLTGAHVRDSWEQIEPKPGVYDWQYLDTQFSRVASLHKHVTLGVYSGVRNDPSFASQLEFNNTVAALGARYSSSPILDAIHMAAPFVTDNSMEMYLPSGINLSTTQIYSTWTSSIDSYNKAFPNNTLVLDLAILPGGLTQKVDEYARSVLGARFEAIVCNLKASTNPQAKHILELERLRAEGVRIGFEMVGPSSDSSRFGGPFAAAVRLGNLLGGSWYQIYQADVRYASSIPEASGWVLLALMCGTILCYYRVRC